jgi:hypothetical protein
VVGIVTEGDKTTSPFLAKTLLSHRLIDCSTLSKHSSTSTYVCQQRIKHVELPQLRMVARASFLVVSTLMLIIVCCARVDATRLLRRKKRQSKNKVPPVTWDLQNYYYVNLANAGNNYNCTMNVTSSATFTVCSVSSSDASPFVGVMIFFENAPSPRYSCEPVDKD